MIFFKLKLTLIKNTLFKYKIIFYKTSYILNLFMFITIRYIYFFLFVLEVSVYFREFC